MEPAFAPEPADHSGAKGDPSLAEFVRERVGGHWYSWAMSHYKETVLALATTYGRRDLLEIGGGRSPLFDKDQIAETGLNYVVNDLSAAELDRCPDWVDKVCFDIASDAVPPLQYDLIFSRMVQEHVRSAEKCYRNIFRLLRPGGIALNFHPTLYAAPFVINYLIPTRLSEAILKSVGPRLTDAEEEYPKFPARYSWCRVSAEVADRIRRIGFSEAMLVAFYGHGYFRKIPIAREIDDLLAKFAQRRDATMMASYAYTIVRK